MNTSCQAIYCLFPTLLAMFFLPELRKRLRLVVALILIPIAYFLLWVVGQMYENHEHSMINFFCLGLIVMATLLCIRSLELPVLISRVLHIATSLVLLVAASSFTALGKAGALLSAAVGLLMGTATIAIGLMADIEVQWKQKLDSASGGGAAYLFPRHSGIILSALLLFGSIPGSLLFLIEDVMLHEISDFSIVGCALVLLITGIASISAYRLFTQNFCGRTIYDLPTAMRREPSRWLGILILFFIIAGLTPTLFLQ